MKAFSFNVTIAAEALDCEVIEDTIRQALTDGLMVSRSIPSRAGRLLATVSSASVSRRLAMLTRHPRPRLRLKSQLPESNSQARRCPSLRVWLTAP
jgi:hypothetical protein